MFLHRSMPLILMFALSVSLITSCDDDPTGPDPEDAPEPPSLDAVEMDLSTFEDADTYTPANRTGPESKAFLEHLDQLQQDEQFTAHEQAALFASMSESIIISMRALPSAFFQEHQWGDPEVDGDTWSWEWSAQWEGESVTINITSESVGNERHWELRYTTEGMEEDLDNELLIASQVADDHSSGGWQIYDMFDEDKDEPVWNLDFEMDGEITTMVELTFDEAEDGQLLYERDNSTSTLQLWDVADEDSHTLIEWDNETGAGFIETPNFHDGERICWDENHEDVDC